MYHLLFLLEFLRQSAGPTDATLQTNSLQPTTNVPMSSSVFQNHDEIDYRGGGKNKYGWNDPPILSNSLQLTPNRPVSMPGRSATAPGRLICSFIVCVTYS